MNAAPGPPSSGPRRLRAELLDPAAARLGESPAWDGARRQLVWVDILAGHVHLSDGDGRPLAVVDVGTHVGAALPSAAGGWLLATRAGFALLDATLPFPGNAVVDAALPFPGNAVVDAALPFPGNAVVDAALPFPGGGASATVVPASVPAVVVTPLLDVHGDDGPLRFNDAKCDPRGRALAGTMRNDEAAGDATLYRLDPGPVAATLLQGRGVCNGLGWSPDGRVLYFVDSLVPAVAAYDYDLATGALGPVRRFVEIDPGLGRPDGLCVDDEGGVWVACYGGAAVRRYRPDGTLDTVVRVPVRYPTCVAFGGSRGDRLFITTGEGDGPRSRPSRGDGGLWAVDPGVTGPPATPWQPLGGAA
jgi:sugar lactone lactonase YvrE